MRSRLMAKGSLSKFVIVLSMAVLLVASLTGCISVRYESGKAQSGSGSSASSAASSAASSSATSSSSSSSTPQAMQRIGNGKVGYIEVPAKWEDRTSDMDPHTVKAYEAVYYADASTNYSSTTLGHDSYAKAIRLTVALESYESIAESITSSFKRDSGTFSSTTSEPMQIDGRNAFIVTSTMTKDKLRVATIVIDRDGDGSTAVSITMNCGETESSANEIIRYARTWKL